MTLASLINTILRTNAAPPGCVEILHGDSFSPVTGCPFAFWLRPGSGQVSVLRRMFLRNWEEVPLETTAEQEAVNYFCETGGKL